VSHACFAWPFISLSAGLFYPRVSPHLIVAGAGSAFPSPHPPFIYLGFFFNIAIFLRLCPRVERRAALLFRFFGATHYRPRPLYNLFLPAFLISSSTLTHELYTQIRLVLSPRIVKTLGPRFLFPTNSTQPHPTSAFLRADS